MRRRALLVAAGGSLASLAGCTGGDTRTPTDEPTDRSPGTPTDSATETPTDVPGPIDVDLETARYFANAIEVPKGRGPVAPDDVVPEAEVPPVLREALREARTDGFETDEASDELLAAIDEFRHPGIGFRFEPYVRLDGTAYEFDPGVPVFVARLEPAVEDYDPDRTAHHSDDFEDSVRAFVETLTVTTTHSVYDEYRMSIVPEAVLAFVETYDYIEEPRGVGRIETEWIDPGPPYTIAVRELTDEDWWGRPVVDAESFPGDLWEFLATVVASDRLAGLTAPTHSHYRTDEVPSAYFESRLSEDDDPYVRLDGTVYDVSVGEPDRAAVPADVTVDVGPHSDGEPSSDAEPPRFTVTVTATEGGAGTEVDGDVEFRNRGALPSLLWIETGTERHLLDSDAYGELRWRETGEGADVDRYVTNMARTNLEPGDALSGTYEVPAAVPPGTYDVWGGFGVRWQQPDADRHEYEFGSYPFQVAVTVGEE